MGYSLGVHARSTALQKKMLAFMEKEYRPHWKIRNLKGYTDCYSSAPRADLDYFQGKRVIGIDYNAGGFERGYAFTLTRWMALRVGTLRRSFKDPKVSFPEPVPFMVYDGYESWPVLQKSLSSVPKDVRWCCVDRFGMKLDVTAVEDYVVEIPDSKAWNKAHAEACTRHGIDPTKPWPNPEPKGIRWKIHDTRNRLLWPEVKKVLAPMRAEMKRLDAAWAKFTA
jgi:hypothetical protein